MKCQRCGKTAMPGEALCPLCGAKEALRYAADNDLDHSLASGEYPSPQAVDAPHVVDAPRVGATTPRRTAKPSSLRTHPRARVAAVMVPLGIMGAAVLLALVMRGGPGRSGTSGDTSVPASNELAREPAPVAHEDELRLQREQIEREAARLEAERRRLDAERVRLEEEARRREEERREQERVRREDAQREQLRLQHEAAMQETEATSGEASGPGGGLPTEPPTESQTREPPPVPETALPRQDERNDEAERYRRSLRAAATRWYHDRRQLDCDRCGGTGILACDPCNGSGRRVVVHTNADGSSYSYYVTCGRCGGSGRLDCGNCNEGLDSSTVIDACWDVWSPRTQAALVGEYGSRDAFLTAAWTRRVQTIASVRLRTERGIDFVAAETIVSWVLFEVRNARVRDVVLEDPGEGWVPVDCARGWTVVEVQREDRIRLVERAEWSLEAGDWFLGSTRI